MSINIKIDIIFSMDTEKIFKLKKQINDLLERRPEYKPYQKKLEEKLNNAGSFDNKMVLLKMLIAEQIINLQNKFDELKIIFHNNENKGK